MSPLSKLLIGLFAATTPLSAQNLDEDQVEAKLHSLGFELPVPAEPVANDVTTVRTGNLVFLAGHGPAKPGGGYVTGKVGEDLSVDDAYEAARLTPIVFAKTLNPAPLPENRAWPR